MSLPILTTAADVEAIVGYLRHKPMGATIAEAKAVLKETLDSRKVAAYTFWGIVSREGDRLKLAPRGWELARKTKTLEQTLREVLDSVVPYRSVLEWIHHQGLDAVTNADVAAQWHDHHAESTGSENENTVKDQAVCFFRVAEAAGLGKMTIGRKGASTRLVVAKDKLAEYIEAGPTSPPLSESIEQAGQGDGEDEDSTESPPAAQPPPAKPSPPNGGATEEPSDAPKLRVFITHGKNRQLAEQVETMLQVAEIDYEVAVKEESTAIPVPEKIFGAMRRCSAGVIVVSKEQVRGDGPESVRMMREGDPGTPAIPAQINPNVLIEIGAAFVLYDRRVVLLWEKGMTVPSNLQGLYRCEFEGEELSWTAGMKLMKALKEFRK